MEYSKLQKLTSFIVIFTLFFSITFRVPFNGFLSPASASNEGFYNLVSIIVDEDTYDKIDSKLERYAEDIQGVLENTRAIILPVPNDVTAFELSSLNESLYFEGYKSLKENIDFESRLVGTVLVGKIPLPVLSEDNKTIKSIAPYTDFEDKTYIYNHETNFYEKNSEIINDLKPEIWHGVIAPNSGDNGDDIDYLEDFFDKTNDFYTGKGKFETSNGIINGNLEESNPSNYKPFVFYYDQFREEKAIHYPSYKAYEAYLNNKEDIVYRRYSKELANKIKEEIVGAENDELSDLIANISNDTIKELFNKYSGPELEKSSDISTRPVIDKATKKFAEIFNGGAIEEIREDVHNAGRYNEGGAGVNVDFIPYIVSILDVVSEEVIKSVNKDLEDEIDNLVKGGLSRNIAVPDTIGVKQNYTSSGSYSDNETYTNFLHGKKGGTVTKAEQCTIFRGSTYNSGTLVEANRGFDIKYTESDAGLCASAGSDLNNTTQGLWGGNSPLNIDMSKAGDGEIDLNSRDLTLSINPLFDILGSKRNYNQENNPSPLNCLDNNFLLTYKEGGDISTEASEVIYQTPDVGANMGIKNGSSINWCREINQKRVDFLDLLFTIPGLSSSNYDLFTSLYKEKETLSSSSDECIDIVLNGANIYTDAFDFLDFISNPDATCTYTEYRFKSATSYITHKSPTSDELYQEITNPITQNLPIDKDRYIDFISANGNYQKINYPYLFRVGSGVLSSTGVLDFFTQKENLEIDLDDYLNGKSGEINNIINSNNPSTLSGPDKEIYNLLKIGTYPDNNLDFVQYLKDKPLKTIEIDGEEKTISYYDYLVFSIYWNKLNSTSAKYKFIIENYLSDNIGGGDFDFILPKNKKIYEIAYLGAPGDGESMYIKLDPKSKGENPYTDIISANSILDTNLMGVGILSTNKIDTPSFKCAPPDGVPIWEWIPAVICWLGNMLPPTIKVSDNQCGGSFLNEIDSLNLKNYEDDNSCINGDVDKDGINDCIESGLEGGSIKLSSGTGSYGYNEIGNLKAVLNDKDGNKIIIDNESYLHFYLKKVEDGSGALVYDSSNFNESMLEEVKDYVYFVDKDIRSAYGETNYNFSTKSKDATITFGVSLEKKDKDGNIVYDIKSNDLVIEVDSNFSSLPYGGAGNDLPGEANSLNLTIGSTVLQSGGSISTNVITILDDNGNPVTGEYYELELSILGNSLEFENGEKTISYTTFEGFRPFRVRSTNGSGKAKIRVRLYKNESNFLSTSADIKVVDNIALDIQSANDSDLKVGKNKSSFDVEVQDFSGNKLSDFNSRLYLNIPNKYGKSAKDYFDIIDGKTTVEFETKFMAGKDIPFEFQVEGIKDSYKKYIDIYPDVPLKIDLKSSNTKMEADPSVSTKIEVELKDAYGNIVFNDDTTSLEIEIDDRYKSIITTNDTSETVKSGKASFIVNGTLNPGTAYVKVSSSPDLSTNTLEIEGQAPFGKEELKISGFKEGEILSDLGKEFFYETDSDNYRSRFNTIKDLQNSEAYVDLNNAQKVKIKNLWNSTNKLIINGVGENVIKIDTFYFWDKTKLNSKNYNALYTVLLGAPYGDFTKKNYLASGMLFDKDNRSLAVTSLLDNPYDYNDIIQVSSEGSIKKVYNNSDLTQDIDLKLEFSENGTPYLDLSNESLNKYIGKIYFNFDDNINLELCNDLSCVDNLDETSIFIQKISSGYTVHKNKNNLQISNNSGQIIFSVDESGKITKNGNVYFELDDTDSKATIFNIKTGNTIIGKMGFYINDGEIKYPQNDSILNGLLKTSPNSIIIKLESQSYALRNVASLQNSDVKSIYYLDPFAKANNLNSFSRENIYSFENFSSQKGLGWKSGNKAMLEFASGKGVGEAVKDYASVGVINLGDPVVFLKKIPQKLPGTNVDRKFDRTIGKKINTTEVSSYKAFDYNNDDKDDILIIGTDKFLKLLENKDINGNLLNQRNLARIVDLGNEKLIQAGDFTGDGFEDIFFINNEGKPFLLNNVKKDFVRYDLEEQFKLSGKITISRVFDMDDDGKDDIITLDDSGSINIFYGGGSSTEPSFTKKTISDEYGITLDSSPRDDLAIVYFDGLTQLAQEGDNSDLLKSNEEFYSNITGGADSIEDLLSSLDSSDIDSSRNTINESVADAFIFVTMPYSTGVTNTTSSNFTSSTSDMLQNLPIVNSSELDGKLNTLGSDINSLINSNSGEISISNLNNTPQTTFIRSQYSQIEGLVVEKIYTDINSSNLKSGEKVGVKVTLTNELKKTLDNIAYLDDVPDLFSIDLNSISNDKDLEVKSGIGNYKFLIDKFSLSPGESLIINYELTARSLSYGYIEVGLFEENEVGDDSFGDIIFKLSEKNCSETVDIFRSINHEDYQKGEKEPTCDATKLELPSELEKNLLDQDGNGVPDYIDELTNGGAEEIKDYKDEIENGNIDSDGDGVPDIDDNSPNFSDENFMDNLDSLNVSVDEISEGIDTLIQGFGCGFGGGSCISMPLNWAPLAPGNDPVVLGQLVGDGLKVGEGLPFFSALTWIPTPAGCLPTVWPASPLGPGCGFLGAGGRLGTFSPTNFVRLFYTPTLTGAHGFAACYGAPAIIAGNIPPQGISPVIPGGNCIVAAYPMDFCSESETSGDPISLGTPSYFGEFGIINGNCSALSESQDKVLPDTNKIDTSFVEDYLSFKENRIVTDNLVDDFTDVFANPAGPGNYGSSSFGDTGPLVSLDGGNDGLGSVNISADSDALKNGNFEDVIQIKNTRISSFPSFLMDWANRQIEEIITKLTDFPTLFIILPDFSGIFNGNWGEYISSGVEESYSKGKSDQEGVDAQINGKISGLESKKTSMDCSGDDRLSCANIDLEIKTLEAKKGFGFKKEYSGIQQAYEFLSNVPFVSIEPETVVFNIPWIDGASIDKAISDWKSTASRWEQEIEEAKSNWTFENESVKDKFYLDASKTMGSLQRNIEILEEYKNFPKKLGGVINKKQDWLEQILCNVETISYITGGRIGKNGERFKTWVELYFLIKAILKSWQLLADVFIDYDAECHECKNERYDSLGSQFELISFIIPDIPVIKFPKWPDIVLDLHNIRAHLSIRIPDFEFNLRPIVLPTLPDLNLPEVPSLSLSLPELPELPTFDISELPDIPALPKIELPDLPPPPKLPKLFSSLEAILNILKLVTKAMCILKKSPFVPEWRAGDQIAFLTERSGYLGFDFLDISLPQFSLPFVDAIEVTTYVNLEFDVEFLVEMARAISIPLNSFTNNTVNMFDIQVQDVDLGETVPGDVDLEVGQDLEKSKILGNKEGKISMNLKDFMSMLALGTNKLAKSISEQSKDELNSREFLDVINRELSKTSIVGNPRFDDLRNVWTELNSKTYSKEDKLISDLQKANNDKFEALKAIINNEKQKIKELELQIKEFSNPSFITKISSDTNSDFEAYNTSLQVYNDKFIESAKNLVVGENKQAKELKTMGEVVLNKFKTPFEEVNKSTNKELITAVATPSTTSTTQNACQIANSQKYKYNYEGLYVVEEHAGEKISYGLFDYHDELTGKEELISIDIDSDSDTDLLYQIGTDLYLKENLNINDDKIYISDILTVKSRNNKFVNGDLFYESVNNLKELTVSSNYINVSFSAHERKEINNYRIEYYDIVDRYMNKSDSTIKKSIIDAFSDSNSLGIESENEVYVKSKNIVYIDSVGDNLSGIKLYTKKLKKLDGIISVSPGTKIYTGESASGIDYVYGENTEFIRLNANSNIEFKQETLIEIRFGEAYISTDENIVVSGMEILSYIGKPLVFESKFEVIDENGLDERSHVELNYYDSSKLEFNFKNIDSYEVYDLGYKDTSYLINLERPNDYLYARMQVFSDDIVGTYSKQILLSPQIQADQNSPELGFSSKIRLPVYQEKFVNFGNYIYEDSGLDNISISIDGVPSNKYEVIDSGIIKFGPFDELFSTGITVNLSDQNNNISSKTISLEVYSPTPEISSYSGATIYGNIDEILTKEPINMYRVRGGSIARLETMSGSTKVDTLNGNYNFDVDNNQTNGLALQVDGKDSGITVNEQTGKISDLPPGYNVIIENGNSLNFPKIIIEKTTGREDIFYEQLRLDGDTPINILDSFSDINEAYHYGLYLQMLQQEHYSYYTIPEGSSYNPGAIVIYRKTDINKEALLVISKDGRIKLVNEYYKLEYTSFGDYVVFKLIDGHYDREMGRILFKVNSMYLIK